MVHQRHLFRHATKLSFSAFNAAAGNGIEKRGRQSTGSATALWVTETLAGTLHVPSVLSSTSITPAIKANGCCDSSRANWLPTQILSLYVLVFAEIYVQCGKLVPVSPVKYVNLLLTVNPAVTRKPPHAVAGQTPFL